MKKEWNNPELKNLSLECTNDEMDCGTATKDEARDGNHWVGLPCHHGLNANSLNCGYSYIKLEDGWKAVIGCNYVKTS